MIITRLSEPQMDALRYVGAVGEELFPSDHRRKTLEALTRKGLLAIDDTGSFRVTPTGYETARRLTAERNH